jgi:hypothetical protein
LSFHCNAEQHESASESSDLEDSDTDEDSDRDEDTTADIEAEDYGTAGVMIGDASSLSLELLSSSVRANAEYQRALVTTFQ